jgi:hypothetical protein
MPLRYRTKILTNVKVLTSFNNYAAAVKVPNEGSASRKFRYLLHRTMSRVWLTFESLAVTLHTTKLNDEKFYVVPTLRLCVLYGS